MNVGCKGRMAIAFGRKIGFFVFPLLATEVDKYLVGR